MTRFGMALVSATMLLAMVLIAGIVVTGGAGAPLQRATEAAPVTPGEAVAAAVAPAPSTYTVRRGDTLYAIAVAHGYTSWLPIFNANRAVISDPDSLTIGTVLVIPNGVVNQTDDEPLVGVNPAASKGDGGGLRGYVYQISRWPAWLTATIECESGFVESAYNPAGPYMGVGQFDWATWNEGQRRFGIYGSPYNGYTAIDMTEAFFRAGESWRWPVCSR